MSGYIAGSSQYDRWNRRQEAKPLTVELISARRWHPVAQERDDDTVAVMRESRSGDWVMWSDYERLRAALPPDRPSREAGTDNSQTLANALKRIEELESHRDRLLEQLKDIIETVGRVPQGAGLRDACIETLPNSTLILQRNNQFITLGQIRKAEALIREIEGGQNGQ